MTNCDHGIGRVKIKTSIGLVLAVFVFISAGCSLLSKKTDKIEKPQVNGPASPAPEAVPAARLTILSFDQIKTDMTYEDVVKIIGSEGALAKASEIGTIRLTTYKWEGENFKRIFCSFRNNKLTVKSQSGL